MWDNFGPSHADRVDAVGETLNTPIFGIELFSSSRTYDWVSSPGNAFSKITLFTGPSNWVNSAIKLILTLLRLRPSAVFFCHYERIEILVAATICRLVGIRAFTMNDSKFDDYERHMWREFGKRLFFLPFQGALVASPRSADYVRFLGVRRERIFGGYDAVSASRIRELAGSLPAPAGEPFASRHFTIVARLVPKKNIALALQALALAKRAGCERKLIICGSGPLEAELKALCETFGIVGDVIFEGFLQSPDVAKRLAKTLALILPSTEEQFGQVIAEAIVMGVPALVSDNCGARDILVRTGVNGFVFEPDNAAGLAKLMTMIDKDHALWTQLSEGAQRFTAQADLSEFVDGVNGLLALPRRRGHEASATE